MEELVKKILGMGADEVEIVEIVERDVSAPFKLDEIGPIKASENRKYRIRVVVDKRVAIVNHIGTIEGLDRTAERAIAIAKASTRFDDWPGLPDVKEVADVKGIHSDDVVSIIAGDYDPITNIVKDVIDLAKGLGIELGRNDIEVEERKVRLVNSNGLDKEYSETIAGITVQAMYGKGAYRAFEIRRDLAVNLERLMNEAAKKAKDADKAELIETFSGEALFEPKVAAELAEVMFATPIRGDYVIKGASPLKDKLDQEIASKEFSLYDDGTMAAGVMSRPFDDEGVPMQNTPIIVEGTLKGFIYDRYRGKKAGKGSTGNFVQPLTRAERPPEIAPTNLVIKPVKGSLEDMISSIDKGLMISSTIGARLSDAISGIYNATVTLGYLIEKGEIKRPVKGVVVNIPFRESLKHARVGAEPIGHYMLAYAPPVVLPNATFAAKK